MSTFELYQRILNECGISISKECRILDWGCGEGAFVREGRALGFEVVGCDFGAEGEHISAISSDYRIPFADNSIDVIFSSQVLEHVMDYDSSISELYRVLKPSGAFLHLFPSRWTVIEPHVYVPFATIFRSLGWLRLWATVGIRNEFQQSLGAQETARLNREYLTTCTNYLPASEILRVFRGRFSDVRFVESTFLKHSPNAKGRALYRLSVLMPFVASLYGSLRGRVLFGRGQEDISAEAISPN